MRKVRLAAILGACGALLITAVPSALSAGARTTRVSVSSSGVQANSSSDEASISPDGRFVAFTSYATNLVRGDTNDVRDVFVHDRETGKTTRVSVSSGGAQANGGSTQPSISPDGRFVAFTSYATNLVGGDTNREFDVFVHDRRTGKTRRVSLSSAGAQGNGTSASPAISANGRLVAFTSKADNLVQRDTNGREDVFVHDGRTGKTRRISVTPAGGQVNRGSYDPSISADGRFVAFASGAGRLVRHDSNHNTDVLVRDRRTGKTKRVSVSSSGAQGDKASLSPAISARGRFVAFESFARNLVRHDHNRAPDVFVHDRKTGKTRRVSVSSAGEEGHRPSSDPSISAGGRFVAFDSEARILVRHDTNDEQDVFIRDRRKDRTRRVSVSSRGAQADDHSYGPSISATGRFVAFNSDASNLVGGDTNNERDVFVRGSLR